MKSKLLVSAAKLHKYMLRHFWKRQVIIGPDPGLRLELRCSRFIKSYLPSVNWSDNHCFLQAQGYWIKSNWDLFEITDDTAYQKVAIDCSRQVLNNQKDNGSWEYPLKAWKKYASTVEGTWASLGLLETFNHTKESVFMEGVLAWYKFLIDKIGFQACKDSLAINYFDSPKWKVPNNTTLVLMFLAELYKATEDPHFLKFNNKMIKFIQLCQNSKGELKYAVESDHYLCYHYNAFEFLDLFRYYEITKDQDVRTILEQLAQFLSTGVTNTGSVKYDCSQIFPEIIFFSGVLGAALNKASTGFRGYEDPTRSAYNFLLKNQRSDGSFIFSRHEIPYIKRPIAHGFLTDERIYPLPLSFILQHLLSIAKSETFDSQ